MRVPCRVQEKLLTSTPGEPTAPARFYSTGTRRRGADDHWWFVDVAWQCQVKRGKQGLSGGHTAHCWSRVHVEEAARQRRYVPAVDAVSSAMPPNKLLRKLQDHNMAGPGDVPNTFMPSRAAARRASEEEEENV